MDDPINMIFFLFRVNQGGRNEFGEEVSIDHHVLTSSVDYISIHVGTWLLGWFSCEYLTEFDVFSSLCCRESTAQIKGLVVPSVLENRIIFDILFQTETSMDIYL